MKRGKRLALTARVEVLAKLSVADQARAYAESVAVVQAHGGGSVIDLSV